MRRLYFVFVLWALPSLLFLSCTKQERRDSSQQTALSAATGFDIQPVEAIDENGFKQLVSQRNGRVLFLNFWATWCQPCVEEFPEIVKLALETSGSSVEFVAISLDYPDEVETKILPFLRDKKVPFKVYVADVQDQDSFINSVNRTWAGALPATAMYDAQGQQKTFVVGQRSLEQFRQELRKLLQSS